MHRKFKKEEKRKKLSKIPLIKVPEGKQIRAGVIFEKVIIEKFPKSMTILKLRFKKHCEPQALLIHKHIQVHHSKMLKTKNGENLTNT